MADRELCFKSIAEMGELIRIRKLSPVEVMQAHLQRIEELRSSLNSWITVLPEKALEAAKKAEQEIQQGSYRGPLHGIPFGLKDVYKTMGIRTTYGCKVYDQYVPDEDSTTVVRLREAGAILVGKLNLHTLAFGGTGQNDYYGDTHNPWDNTRITGGSSSGSASAVASGECGFAMGSDTGGSIRIPAGLCGTVGLKTTFGRLSLHGIMEACPSMDHHGPMTRTVEDCALVLNVIAGYDPKDPRSAKANVPDYTKGLTGNIKGLRIGVPKEFFEIPIEPDVVEAVQRALKVLSALGATVIEVSWAMFHYAYAISTAIIMADIAYSLKHLVLKHSQEIDPMVRNRIELGFFVPITRYLQAQRARAILNRQSYDIFKHVDILAGPTLPLPAPKIGETEVTVAGTRINFYKALVQYTRPYSLNGLPAISIPCGFTNNHLPIGIQLASRPFGEETLLQTAYAYEQATQWHRRRRPPL